MASSSQTAVLLLVAFSLSVACNQAQDPDRATPIGSAGEAVAPSARTPHEVPQVALDACQDKRVGDACTVELRDKQLDAQCAPTEDGRVACMPPRRQREKP